MSQGPVPLGPYQQQPVPPPRSHTARNILIGSAGGFAVLLVGVGIGAAGSSKSTAAPQVTVTAAARPGPAVTITVTAPPSAASAPTRTHSARPKTHANLLFKFSGSGIRNSRPFLVNAATVTAHFTYNCAAAGGSGNFIADMVSGNPSSLSSDDQSIANALGSGGSQTTTLYPQNQGSRYHLTVNSECSWSITLTNG
jgi:hypothetical protein